MVLQTFNSHLLSYPRYLYSSGLFFNIYGVNALSFSWQKCLSWYVMSYMCIFYHIGEITFFLCDIGWSLQTSKVFKYDQINLSFFPGQSSNQLLVTTALLLCWWDRISLFNCFCLVLCCWTSQRWCLILCCYTFQMSFGVCRILRK